MSAVSSEIKMPDGIAELANYHGSKGSSGTYQKIISRIPSHQTLVIPFLGHCAITRNIKLPELIILNDIDQIVTDAWNNALVACGWIQRQDSSNLTKAAKQFISRFRKLDSGSNIRAFGDDGQHIVILTNSDALNVLLAAPDTPNTFAYLDPPYMMRSRKQQRKIYNFESNLQLHEKVKAYLTNGNKTKKMLSHYEDEMYNQMKGFQTFDFQSMTRSGLADERIYFNYSIRDTELQDYRYIGDGFKERERIKLKVQRHVARLKKLKPEEREAIITAIIKEFR